MAYTFFPKTASEIKTTLKGDKKKIEEIINVFAYLKSRFKSVETPINVDPTKISKINVTRDLQGDIDLAKIKRETKISNITMKFGSGSSEDYNTHNGIYDPIENQGYGDAFDGSLRQIGFDVFDDVIDHSYDNILDDRERIKAVISEIDRLNSLDLFEIYIDQTTGVFRFHAGKNFTTSIIFQGNPYIPIPVEFDGFEFSADGKQNRPMMKIANVDGYDYSIRQLCS